MLVVVVGVRGVTVSVVDVVEVVVMGDGLMPAGVAVDVVVAGMFDVGQGVLVVMAVMADVGVTVVDVVGVAIVVDRDVPAAGPVFVIVIGMNRVFGDAHGISFEWLMASATM